MAMEAMVEVMVVTIEVAMVTVIMMEVEIIFLLKISSIDDRVISAVILMTKSGC